MNPERRKHYLCLDAGGTSIKYAFADENGSLLEEGKVLSEPNIEAFLMQTEQLYRRFAPLAGIAGSFPGEVHSEEGVIHGISALPHLHECELKKLISDRCCGVRVTMLNDANAAALGELWKGVGRAYQNIAFVIVGTGVGGAVIERGSLYPGTTMNKAEIGNFLMGGETDGELHTWSSFTLEKEARRYSELTGTETDGRELVRLARAGLASAGEHVNRFLHYMAVGLLSVQFAYDPEIIAIGGGISSDSQLIEDIRTTYRDMVKGQMMGYLMPNIVACENQNDANLLGALYYHLNYEQESNQEE